MKYLGSFAIIISFIALISSFYVKYTYNDENAVVEPSGLLKYMETFPRENFDNLLNTIDEFREVGKIVNTSWNDFDNILDYVEFIGKVLYSLWLIVKSLFMFIYYALSYSGEVVIWILKIPVYILT